MSAEPSLLLDWHGHTSVVIASGPSLTTEQLDLVEASPTKTIVVNTTWEDYPHADVLFAGDFLWWKVHHGKSKAFKGQRWTQDRTSAERFGVNWVRGEAREGLGTKGLRVNGNTGIGAINLAFLFGSRRILLIGMDMKLGPKGEKHHHEDHPAPLVQKQLFQEWRHKARWVAKDLAAAKCEVVNCTPGSALDCFPMGDLKTELAK